MSPSCRLSLLVSCLVALACSDTTNPKPTLTKRIYELGDSIATGYFGRCRDICIPNRIGVFDDSTVTLTYQEYPPDLPVYRYRLLADQ